MRFTDILAEQGITFLAEGNKHCRPGWVQIDCPFCGRGAGKFHMGYNLSKGYLSCYKCGSHRTIDTLMALVDCSFKKAKEMLSDVEHVRDAEPIKKRGTLKLPSGIAELNNAHRQYIRNRGFDVDEIVSIWGVKGIGLAAELSYRLFLPIHYRGEVVSWTTRSIKENATQRYISASAEEEAYNHKELLYGEDNCRHAICAVEGPISAWAIGTGGAATCGTAIKRAQVARIAKYPVRGICFDAEPEAQRRARALYDELSVFPGETINFVLDVKDPAEELKRGGRDLKLIRKELGL